MTPPGVRVDDFAAAMNGAGNVVVGWIRGNGDVVPATEGIQDVRRVVS